MEGFAKGLESRNRFLKEETLMNLGQVIVAINQIKEKLSNET
jgi:hypothetical protein